MTSQWVTCPHCQTMSLTTGDCSECPSCGKAFSAIPTSPRWFYVRDKKKQGPVSEFELKKLAAEGRLTATDMVLREGTTRWQSADSIDGLFPAAGSFAGDKVSSSQTVSVPPEDDTSEDALPAAIPVTGWFYTQNKLKIGPIPFEQLQELVRMGAVKPTDMVLQQGSHKWQPASAVPDLCPAQSAAIDNRKPEPATSRPESASSPAPTVETLPKQQEEVSVSQSPSASPPIPQVVAETTAPSKGEPSPAATEPPAPSPSPTEAVADTKPLAETSLTAASTSRSESSSSRSDTSASATDVATGSKPVPSSSVLPPLNLTDRSQIISRFESAWLGGKRPELDDYLPPDANIRGDVLPDMVRIDIECRLNSGEPIEIATYFARYPELTQKAATAADLIAAEFNCRKKNNHDVSEDEYCRRFPQFAEEISRRLRPEETGEGEQAQDPSFPVVPGFVLLEKQNDAGLFKAKQLKPERSLAIEVCQGDVRQRERFLEAARALERVLHPNVISVVDLGQHDDIAYCAFEWIEGRTLASLADEVTYRQAAEVMEAVADGLAEVHRHDIAHRNLTCETILLVPPPKAGEDGERPSGRWLPKLTGFRLRDGLMDIERMEDHADIRACGMILYRLLTGIEPFRTKSSADLFPTPPSQIRPNVPRDLDYICLKCFENEPGKRYEEASELASDLRCFLFEKPISSRASIVARVDQRYWIVPTIGIAAVACLLLFLAIRFVGWGKGKESSGNGDVPPPVKQVDEETAQALARLQRAFDLQRAALREHEKWLLKAQGDADIAPRLALLFLAQGKTEQYKQIARFQFEHFARSLDPETAYDALWLATLWPETVDPQELTAATAKLMAAHPKKPARFLVLQGAVAFRAGRHKEAIDRLIQALAAEPLPPAAAYLFLAMAHHKLELHESAREWLDRAREWKKKSAKIPDPDRGSATPLYPWTDNLIVDILLQQAEEMMDSPLP
ncbi:MAG: hypothetical protein KatS3mg105_3726 [Gemmatales bacterium]|nr:MAG: hypothetical protein KatS3mg105_3726 [Gemmatales bacterium]